MTSPTGMATARAMQRTRNLNDVRGTGWGDAGYFRMRLRTYEQLNGVDLKQMLA